MPAVTRVSVERIVACPFSVAHEYAVDFFRSAERGIELRLPLRDFVWGLRGRVRRPVRLVFALHPDEIEDGRVHDAMMLEWTAGTSLFPHFHGTLRLRIDSVETTRLTLEGAYRPPLGRLGQAVDLLIGRRVARSTMSDLLGRLSASMERRETAYRAGVPPSGITV